MFLASTPRFAPKCADVLRNRDGSILADLTQLLRDTMKRLHVAPFGHLVSHALGLSRRHHGCELAAVRPCLSHGPASRHRMLARRIRGARGNLGGNVGRIATIYQNSRRRSNQARQPEKRVFAPVAQLYDATQDASARHAMPGSLWAGVRPGTL